LRLSAAPTAKSNTIKAKHRDIGILRFTRLTLPSSRQIGGNSGLVLLPGPRYNFQTIEWVQAPQGVRASASLPTTRQRTGRSLFPRACRGLTAATRVCS
jgi:hypothetical protein